MADWHRPDWLTCLGDGLVEQYQEDIEGLEDDELVDESYRMEVSQPPEQYNDRDFRTYRRLVRQEMHRRGLD